ncbi:MAG: OadG family protein [Verrucomicrobiota bacterium]|nr:OadG family protein [Verrucomicrobiota bacterium]
MSLIVEGLKLMVVGMGTVFVFLIIMIMLIILNAKACVPFSHLLKDESKSEGTKADNKKENGILTAVITAAIHRYRTEMKNK